MRYFKSILFNPTDGPMCGFCGLCDRVCIFFAAAVWILFAAAQAQDEVDRAFLLDVVVGERAPLLELFACEYKALLIWRDTFLRVTLQSQLYVTDADRQR